MNLRPLACLPLPLAFAAIICACALMQADELPQRALYVAPGGDDANPGTRRAPLRTIGAAARAASAGITVLVAPGTYPENIKSTASGNAAARIRYVSAVKWGAKIVGSGTEAAWENHGSHVEIFGFDVSGSGRAGLLNHGSWVRMAGNRVHDLALSGGCTGSGGGGIVNANYQASDGEISGNVVHDIGAPGACPGVQGIYYANLRGRIHNNIVYRVSAWGIHLWHAADQVVIANNTVFSNGSDKIGGGIVIGTGDRPGGVVLSNTQVINNIVVHHPRASIRQYCYPGEACIGDGNLVANNVVYGNGANIEMLVGKDTGTISADPLFLHFRPDGKGDYRLQPGSPALKRGLAEAAPATDIDGARRPRGAAVDIGAYQER
ncbi:right-handed parallel beta-helix repeat-containing protein [Massilia niastensis]|uniref:right-handed parallel beta-helix repeat-containing protein n=1 Tax=Massilia niastensis TaxID=544911 RepID=UPI000364F3B2|nr:right-handed parallel beta-helix repeat-containing protein [Massilia niastensis]